MVDRREPSLPLPSGVASTNSEEGGGRLRRNASSDWLNLCYAKRPQQVLHKAVGATLCISLLFMSCYCFTGTLQQSLKPIEPSVIT